METIFAPWRMAYIRGGKAAAGCILCRDSLREEALVMCEGKTGFVMMNRYPYTGGHLMIVPYRHLCCLGDLTLKERLELLPSKFSVAGADRSYETGGIQHRHEPGKGGGGRRSIILSISMSFPGGSAIPTS